MTDTIISNFNRLTEREADHRLEQVVEHLTKAVALQQTLPRLRQMEGDLATRLLRAKQSKDISQERIADAEIRLKTLRETLSLTQQLISSTEEFADAFTTV